ncbi:hypothetical protein NW759_009775 [Fusarium solani]|uniref:Uncharacterized protein n=1 Tax=Fusarium solani TaxID=169388 RepID=A0A9P9H1H1_FUSSL|nr:uncharacterized protein B0J15DRAFT_53216 [Fusarium solani]KAH7249316.1 hypothetical protein B0J15DRAFT_53216 [Fusarium solani]KAJ4215354.1 hypothetical protein NW759_009775 [Fusarium solani]
MTLTDEELDRDWQPSGRRPQSTIARSFSAELMDIFRIENSLSDLDQQVHDKKQTVDKNTEELASLEARIREMEDRLRRSAPGGSRPSLAQVVNKGAADDDQQHNQNLQAEDASKDDAKARSRPGTARATQQAPSSGNMPPTPGASEDGDHE